MKPITLAVTLLVIGVVSVCHGESTSEQLSEAIASAFKVYEDRLNNVEAYFANLARQVMLQQFNSEQRVRTDGYSGVKAIRGSHHGPANYYSKSHVGTRFMAIHDHADFIRTMGMGEINVVINGVDFSTRHNDYKLVMSSTSSTEYHATEPIPFPEVPPSVTELDDIDAQTEEMRTYFKAFATQNTTLRDYRPYFKANLCYMEAAWTLDKSIEEPFESDRHQLDAASWLELQSLIRYGAYTGTKSPDENFAHLPTTIMHVNKTTGEPAFAQWNYRILCSPIEQDIPLKYLKQVEDLQHDFPRNRVGADNKNLRSARFVLYDHEDPKYERVGLLDYIFYNISGKDNRATGLTQQSYGYPLYLPYGETKELQDTSRYARATELGGEDAMGNKFLARGFNDPNLWCAETTQPRVAPIITEKCATERVGKRKVETCESFETRFSWAIPLEIVYMTPLFSWNPYKIPYSDSRTTATEKGKLNGATEGKAYNGTDLAHYYITPVQFYKGTFDSNDNADTAKGGVWVRDATDTPRKCSAAGPRIITPNIEGVGNVRLRYPIAPVHGEGSAVWKELNAFKDLYHSQSVAKEEKSKLVHFRMATTFKNPPGEHYHEFTLSVFDFKKIRDEGQSRMVTTSLNQGHTHDLLVVYRRGRFEYKSCSGVSKCSDGHLRDLTPDPEDVANI
ncbi:hypothetical protein PoB_002189000 [Plakobranchus ocellatus]|uniref:Uncharacterized protein n=1 Tax=Plakobranchus ocellatus TaxID=259542 RepID=A0AAV3ZJR5_9GAST|nr:hypothetical protein PoB_002189000 [Plakobranchus ocellatus]